MNDTFRALVVRKGKERTFSSAIEDRVIDDLPEGDVLIRVAYSTINYKDMMSCLGNPAISRKFPHTPGVDAAGIVVESTAGRFELGEEVCVISQPMGLNMPGGFGQYVRVPYEWVMPVPMGLTMEETMAFGTAGFTAALAVEVILDNGKKPGISKIAISGATGGVGAVSIAILAGLDFDVTAITGKMDADKFLRSIGASGVVLRDQFIDETGRNMLPATWDAAIDVASGMMLSTLIRSANVDGVVVATGMVQGTEFDANVLPFILRGTRLIGINAEANDMARRHSLWSKIATDWKPSRLDAMYETIKLDDVPLAIERIVNGTQIGRIVIDLN